MKRYWIVWCALLCLGGCVESDAQTEIVFRISSSYGPGELREVEVEHLGSTKRVPADELPTRIQVRLTGSLPADAALAVRAFRTGEAVAAQTVRATASFEAGERRLVEVRLRPACEQLYEECEQDGLTCGGCDRCIEVARDSVQIDRAERAPPPLECPTDGGMPDPPLDGSQAMDAGVDASMEPDARTAEDPDTGPRDTGATPEPEAGLPDARADAGAVCDPTCEGAQYCASGGCRTLSADGIRQFGLDQDDRARDVLFGPSGNLYATGVASGAVDFGAGTDSTGGTVFIASYSDLATHRWTRRFGLRSNDSGMALAWHDGSLYVAGVTRSAVQLDGVLLELEQAAESWFLAVLNPATGQDARVGALVTDRSDACKAAVADCARLTPFDMVVDPQGNACIAGTLRGNLSVSVGDQGVQSFETPLDGSSNPLTQPFLACLAPDGSLTRAHLWKASGQGNLRGLAQTPDGALWAVGSVTGTVEMASFGSDRASTTEGAFVTRLAADGTPETWFATGGTSLGMGIASGTGNEVFVAGQFRNSVGWPGCAMAAGNDYDSYLVRFSATDRCTQLHPLGPYADEVYVQRLARDDRGHLFLAGHAFGALERGGRGFPSFGDDDLWAASLDESGELRWAITAGASGRDVGFGIAVAPALNDSTDRRVVFGGYAADSGATLEDGNAQPFGGDRDAVLVQLTD